jgi:uncharacterized protein involved in exopolysaccharide biosynthesis
MEEYEVSLKDYIDVIIKEKQLIISIFFVAVAVAGLYSMILPKVYETKTTLLITPRITEELKDSDEVESTTLFPSSFSTETYEKLAVTNDLLMGIIDTLGLERNGEKLTVEALREMMEPRAEFASNGRTRSPLPLLTMTVRGSDPVEIKNIADTWGRLFIAKNMELLSTRTAQSYEFISARFDEVNEELKKKEEEKVRYMKENPLATLTTELKVLNSKYNSHLSRLLEKKRELNAKEASLQSLEREIGDREGTLNVDKSILTQIALEQKVYLSLEDYLIDAKVSVDVLKEEVSYLEKETERLKKEIDEKEAKVNEVKLVLGRLDREISALKQTYKFLSQRLQEARIAKEEQLQSIKVVESPVVPQVPSGPSKILNIAIAGVLGLFVGVFGAFFKNYMESS